MMVWSLFIIGLMGLFFYNKIGSIIPMVVLPTTEIIEPKEKTPVGAFDNIEATDSWYYLKPDDIVDQIQNGTL